MREGRRILLSIGLALASMDLAIKHTRSSSGALTVIKPNKKPTVIPKKIAKPKSKNYTSKMKMKPNTVRKDFNQRRR